MATRLVASVIKNGKIFPFFPEFVVAEQSSTENVDKSFMLEGSQFSGDASRGAVSEIWRSKIKCNKLLAARIME